MAANSYALPKHAAMVNVGGVDGRAARAGVGPGGVRRSVGSGRLLRPQTLLAQAIQNLQRMLAARREDVIEALPPQHADALQRRGELQVGKALGLALAAIS